jgi:ferritin-like metal-binding protein YciE
MQQTRSKAAAGSPRKNGGAAKDKAPAEGMDADLQELFHATLKDIYYAEKQILKALPRMSKAARSEKLKEAFDAHKEQTAGQIERLEEVFEMLGKRAQGATCEAILGLVEEGKEIMEDFKGKDAIDIGLVGAAKAVEHYEMARYESLSVLARQLGMTEAERLLRQNLQEEEQTDELLDTCCTERLAELA